MTSPSDGQVTALARAAREREGGVDCDGLVATHDDGRYALETPEGRRDGLDEDGFRAVARDYPDRVTNWHYWDRDRSAHGRAFLRWIEGAEGTAPPERHERLAEGVSREWGQLWIRARLAGTGTGSNLVGSKAHFGIEPW